jgi:ABC-type multidrug transport system fused ATPase/permease subunit
VHPAGPHQAGLFLCRFATFLSKLIETFFIQDVSKSKAQALKYSGFFYAMAAGFFCAALVQGYMFAVVGSRLSLRVRKLFFEAVLHMEMGWFDKDENSSGSLTSRLSADAPSIRGATGDVLGVVTQNLVTLIVGACCTAIDHVTSRTGLFMLFRRSWLAGAVSRRLSACRAHYRICSWLADDTGRLGYFAAPWLLFLHANEVLYRYARLPPDVNTQASVEM